MHAILKHWHPMIGRDFHIPWPPGSPAPAPAPVPYQTTQILHGTGITCSKAPTHTSQGFGITMQQGTDIGPMIPHIGPPSTLLPLEIIFSSSKSYFGVARYPVEGKPMAVALLLTVNMNLNCGTPMPTPTGMVMALNTHFVNMTMADFIFGLNHMALDCLLQTALQFIGGRLGEGFAAMAGPYVQYLTYRLGPQLLSRNAAKLLLRSQGVRGNVINDAARALRASRADAIGQRLGRAATMTETAAGVLTGWFLGGPMGIDNATVGGPTVVDAAQGAVNNYMNSPSVPEHGGSSPPAASPASPSAAPSP